jgi:hypothetical protein
VSALPVGSDDAQADGEVEVVVTAVAEQGGCGVPLVDRGGIDVMPRGYAVIFHGGGAPAGWRHAGQGAAARG